MIREILVLCADFARSGGLYPKLYVYEPRVRDESRSLKGEGGTPGAVELIDLLHEPEDLVMCGAPCERNLGTGTDGSDEHVGRTEVKVTLKMSSKTAAEEVVQFGDSGFGGHVAAADGVGCVQMAEEFLTAIG